MPDYVPISPQAAVFHSGWAEIAGGLAVIPPSTRKLARWWLIVLLVAVFPANVHMAVSPEQIKGLDLRSRAALGALGAAAAPARRDHLGLARNRRLTLRAGLRSSPTSRRRAALRLDASTVVSFASASVRARARWSPCSLAPPLPGARSLPSSSTAISCVAGVEVSGFPSSA